MNTLLIILPIVLVLAGIAGSVVPALPGPPLSWAALLMLSLSDAGSLSPGFLIGAAAAAIVITVLDYAIPSLSTRHHGGGKAGVWGCNIGLAVSLFGLPFGPQGLVGVIFWPFVGAFAGEFISRRNAEAALRAAWGAFVGFLAGTGLKLSYGLTAAFVVARDLIV